MNIERKKTKKKNERIKENMIAIKFIKRKTKEDCKILF